MYFFSLYFTNKRKVSMFNSFYQIRRLINKGETAEIVAMYISKQNNMVNLDLEDLPNELLLKILSYLKINSIISCGLLSKRIRFISHDISLWQKINLHQKTVPTKFLKFVMKNGCKYLSLSCAKLKENSTLQRKSDIRFLKDLRLNLKNYSYMVKD